MPANQGRPRGDSAPRPPIGTPFNPNREICGFYGPDIVGRQHDLQDGPKRLYERAVRWAGKNGAFWYSFPTMAAELGKCERQVRSDMAALEAYGLIAHRRRQRQSNRYVFLWHPVFERQDTANQDGGFDRQDSVLDRQDTVKKPVLDRQSTAGELCNTSLNCETESSSSAFVADVQHPLEATGDDRISARGKNKTPEGSGETEAATKPGAKKNLSDKGKGNTEAATAIEAATIPEAAVKMAQEKLHQAGAASLSRFGEVTAENLAKTPWPDAKITRRILNTWRDVGDDGSGCESWLAGTVKRELLRKVQDPRRPWGLYLEDAKTEAENLPIQRAAAAKYEAAAEIERARRQAEQADAEAEAAAEADRPMEQAEAFEFIRASIQPRGVPRPVNRRLQRTGELISPNALEAVIRGWQRCRECQDWGTVGDAIDKTLAFCSCAAGIEARELPTSTDLAKPEAEGFHRGADWPVAEIARVHAGVKSLLVAAARSVGLNSLPM